MAKVWIERKLVSAKLFVESGIYEVSRLLTVYEDGKVVATGHEHTTISQEEYDTIRKTSFLDELNVAQLEQITKKDEELKVKEEEKAVLVSEKLALVDEVELHKSEKEEMKVSIFKE